jgi:hypothetical protein
VKDGSSMWRQTRQGEEWEEEHEVGTDKEKRENTDGKVVTWPVRFLREESGVLNSDIEHE